MLLMISKAHMPMQPLFFLNEKYTLRLTFYIGCYVYGVLFIWAKCIWGAMYAPQSEGRAASEGSKRLSDAAQNRIKI